MFVNPVLVGFVLGVVFTLIVIIIAAYCVGRKKK